MLDSVSTIDIQVPVATAEPSRAAAYPPPAPPAARPAGASVPDVAAKAAQQAPSAGVPSNPDPGVIQRIQQLQVRRSVQNRLQLLQVELNLNSQQIRDAILA